MSNGVDFRKLSLELREQLTAAQSELAALREELASANADKAAYGQNAIDLRKRWNSINSALQRRNMLNERMQDRLDERDDLLRAALPAVKYESGRGDDAGRQYTALVEKIEATLAKPTESGASEYVKSCEVAHEALKMENQRITPARFKCLACGDYHEGSGNLPCPKMRPMSGASE